MTSLLGAAAHPVADGRALPMAEFVAASGLLSVVVGVSKDPNAKVTLLLVSSTLRKPVLAVKAPTTAGAAEMVEAERRMLRRLPELLPDALLETVPRFLHTVEFAGRSAIVTTAAAGCPMMADYLRRGDVLATRAEAHFAALDRWLGSLHMARAGPPGPIDMDGGVIALLKARFMDDARVASDVDHLAEIHDRLRQHSVPRTVVHGDLWFGNVLLENDRVSGVVDWEEATTRGEPVRDLVRFALTYALYLDWRTRAGRRVRGIPGLRASAWGAGIEFGLHGAGWFPDLFRGFLQNGLDRLGAPRDLWRDAVLAGVAEMAVRCDDANFGRKNLTLFRRLSASHHTRRS
jgi:aminoglycoside phosphotransferase (APT) family kinase protein